MKQENNHFWIGGKNTVLEVIKHNPNRIKQILYSQDLKIDRNNYKKIKFTRSNNHEFEIIFKDSSFVHQGIAAQIKKTEYQNDKGIQNLTDNQNIVIIDNISDPRNLGSIIRTCVAFGVKILILEKGVNIDSHYLYKSASGATEHINFIKVSNINNAIRLLKKNNFFIYSSNLKSKKFLEEINFSENNCIILGSESKGVRQLVLKNSDETFKIAQTKNIDSLNVSNSAAIILNHLFQKKRAR